MNYLIMGASGGLGQALAYRFAAAGHGLVIASSDARDLNAIAADIKLRFGTRVVPVPVETSSNGYLEQLFDAASELGSLDGLLFPLGGVSPDDAGSVDPETSAWLVRVNFLVVVDTIARWLRGPRTNGRGVVVGFGSIAATRGRSANVVYSASKRALQSYFESLRHYFAREGPVVQFYVLGYLDTSLASGRTKLFPKASPLRLAERVLHNLDRDIGVVYFRGYWRWVCLLLRHLPWIVYKNVPY